MCTRALAAYLVGHPDALYNLSPHLFEELIAHILRDFGFEVALTLRTRDGGIDIVAIQTNLAGIDTRYIIECKRWARHRAG